ncbi:Pyruvate/2-oxoglutarate dehydrogenase complex dihydrolipoamide dehydrogenase (E3) component [Rubrobacter radiotolerans]|uniref:FAD-dependent oxidoreductase n=1 Tax=Rubrobacter radiotolerans TaxID=42256 RepID=A0A023X4N8_RUBRA|nr:FAD-dependent oxidoreductase [Rubrobacter radiotolerans]AHY47313.1 Pyruvate/2-oxoglutarate dehydrogenase complex dihydrolipoamide dehydrogenase (E3) component [Rubrobacter radiotolerans]MDX5894717.1 FAD-dependent oxidoreductase [Rubrobacter radiotolerans]SMC06599.1 Pyruvate/2-oxoglutarate dehydrogenase complex, dihydrolipoamide dehydrogenase (E3) component [Rubrobacter radiotolerans DSM 5868]
MGAYDLVVVGGGTAGLVAAAGGASLGARVALVERDKLGGDCLHYGCVPTKTLVRSAKVAHTLARARDFGMKPVRVEVDFPAVMERMRRAVETVGAHDDPARFERMGVELYLGKEARFESPRELSVSGKRLKSVSVILATGSHSVTPRIEGIEEVGYVTHVEALGLERLPSSLVVVGSGPIGCEFAQIFARFGCRVTMVCASPLPLPREDPEIGEALLRFLEDDGVAHHGGFVAREARAEGGEKVVTAYDADGQAVEARGEEILIAAGRAATVGGLGLENAGIAQVSTGVMVDEYLCTSAPDVYAAGDVTGKHLYTHVADYQAKVALGNALFPIKRKADYSVVPWTTFTDPEVARVGLTERQARERRDDVKVYRYGFDDLDRAVADGEPNGFAKIVTDGKGRILGGHIIGPDAGNLIPEVVLAMRRNIPVQALSTTIHVYPTLSEVVKRAADNYYREKLFTGRNRKLLSAFFGLKRRLLS